jgi:conjugal transfer ATP-binding protein TraC
MSDFLRTVADLFSAVNGKDGSHEANQALKELDFPSLTSLLPYRFQDNDGDLMINEGSIGFILEAQPLIGANESIVEAINEMLLAKLPRGVPLMVTMISSKAVGSIIDRGLSNFSWSGEHAEKFNAITRTYYRQAARDVFNNRPGLPLSLRDFKLYFTYGEPCKRPTPARLHELSNLKKVLRSALEGAQLRTQSLTMQELLATLREMVNHDSNQIDPYSNAYNEKEEIHQQIVERDLTLKVMPNYLLTERKSVLGQPIRTRIQNFMLESNPERFHLWQAGDNISNLLQPENTIPCPFVMTYIVEVQDQPSAQGEATRKFFDLEKKAKSTFAKFLPGTVTQAKEWEEIRGRLLSNESALAYLYFNISLFTVDDDEAALSCERALQNTFKKNGLSMYAPTFMQLRNYLAMFPFVATEGLWDDLRKTGATCRAESWQASNLFPIVADSRLGNEGLLIPSYRGQTAFYDMFGEGLGNTNYNMAVTGTSGAGKSVLVQGIIRQVLDSGGIAWTIDMGDSYKSFCANVGGIYLDGQALKFNPFANVSDISHDAERIRDQLSVLADPDGMLDKVHEALLLESVQHAWTAKQTNARIDDVVEFLNLTRKSDRYSAGSAIIGRIDEIVKLLEKYCSSGIYGEYFNSSTPSLTSDAKYVVLELGGLSDKPDLLAAVMFSLMIYIEGKMYRSPRSQKKLCVIDEGWALISGGNEKTEHFIEKGYRTVRRHRGAFLTITQNIKDFEASRAAQAAWGNSSTKCTLKQDSSEFKLYNRRNEGQFSEFEQRVIGRFGAAKDNWFSSLMLKIDDSTSFHRLLVDPVSRVMFSSSGADFEYREKRTSEGASAEQAIYELAQLRYPEEMERLENAIW